MTVKFLHVRVVDENNCLSPTGGVTVAYTISDVEGLQQIFLNYVKCHPNELFCYKTGREIAEARLKDEGPDEILDLEHPISDYIVDWLGSVAWPAYNHPNTGFSIDIVKDERGRWISDFEPSQNDVFFESETVE